MISRFVANSENTRFQGGSPGLLRYYIGGYRNLLEYYMGRGLPNLLQYYNGGGSLGTPNLYYVIYGRPLITIHPKVPLEKSLTVKYKAKIQATSVGSGEGGPFFGIIVSRNGEI